MSCRWHLTNSASSARQYRYHTSRHNCNTLTHGNLAAAASEFRPGTVAGEASESILDAFDEGRRVLLVEVMIEGLHFGCN